MREKPLPNEEVCLVWSGGSGGGGGEKDIFMGLSFIPSWSHRYDMYINSTGPLNNQECRKLRPKV